LVDSYCFYCNPKYGKKKYKNAENVGNIERNTDSEYNIQKIRNIRRKGDYK